MNHTVDKNNGLPTCLTTTNGRLKIELLGWAEPNNGRMLWKANCFFDGETINQDIFKNNWNYLNIKIDEIQICDDTERYYFIPVEGTPILIDSDLKETIKLPYYGTSTANFQSSTFTEEFLIQTYFDAIVLTSLKSHISYIYNEESGKHFLKTRLSNQSKISTRFYKVQNQIRTEGDLVIDISKFKKLQNG